jgi:DNA end-binding protein Ku
VNEITGEEVPWNEIVKAYEHDKGEFVLLTDEDFKRAAPKATEAVEIEDFVDQAQIPPEYFDKPYFLVPTKAGQKAYALLRETMRKSGKIGIARVVIRTREYLAALATSVGISVEDVGGARYHDIRSGPGTGGLHGGR